LRTVLVQNGSKDKVCPQSNRLCGQTLFKQILRGEKELHVKGMWSDWLKNGQFPDNNIGYCIKCKAPIPFNENNPLCGKCNDNNVDGGNNFCHKCGKDYQSISLNFPLCRMCYDIIHIKSTNGA
jgi:methionyl-tRNA synthetase